MLHDGADCCGKGALLDGKAVSTNAFLETSRVLEMAAFLLACTAAITAQLHLTQCQ